MGQQVSIRQDFGSTLKTMIFRHLDTDGDGTGTKNANVNGAITPVVFKIQAGENEILELNRMIVHIADNGSILPHTYGALAALSNGLDVGIYDAGDVLIQENEVPLKANGQWGRVCYDVSFNDRGAGFDGFCQVRWTFSKTGQPMRLTEGQSFRITVNDDLTGLLEHYFHVQGVRR
jgi:hypothetical protein